MLCFECQTWARPRPRSMAKGGKGGRARSLFWGPLDFVFLGFLKPQHYWIFFSDRWAFPSCLKPKRSWTPLLGPLELI